ncbi:MAG: lysophospholipid acyltransferase family protein [Candidatus Kapabacteria bacterium]|nr:lysophospholipid acyltransferase family protein [Candidatus Kapabacteria bacterium]
MQTTTTADVLTAQRKPLAMTFWGWYFERSLRRSFHRVLIHGDSALDPWARGSASGPAILYATHGSWWDAALAMVISLRTHHLPAFGMMEYKQLVKYQFFRSIGLFSVVREDARSALASLQYGSSLLAGSNNVLWMFPQGTLVHQDKRPLNLDPGLAILCRYLGTCSIIPVAMRYDVVHEQRPVARIRVGKPVWLSNEETGDIRGTLRRAEDLLTSTANEAYTDALHDEERPYRVLLEGAKSMEKRFDEWKRWARFTSGDDRSS